MKGKAVFSAMGNQWGSNQRRVMEVFARYYKAHDWVVVWERFNSGTLSDSFASAEHIYIWNGADRTSRRANVMAANSPGRTFFVEHGHFPQRSHLHVAEFGLYGRHPGLHADWDAALTESDWQKFRGMRERLQRSWNPTRDVLVPLQVSKDVQLEKFGNGYSNDHLVRLDLGADKWIRHHPKNPFKHPAEKVDTHSPQQAPLCYSRAYGINSTMLLEAALIGLDVTALGQSYLDWSRDRDTALTAILACQIPHHATDLTPWIRPHMGLQQLEDVH